MDESRFEEIYGQMARPLWLYISRMSRSESLADDLLQETFIRFLGKPIDDETGMRSYLYRIATNLVYDHFRRAKRENNWVAGSEQIEDIAIETASDEESEMMQYFHRLKPRERSLLWLAYVEGFDHKEIAVAMNINALSVRVLLYRARKQLADSLRDESR
jgi:RNA polymerase sigma-70 factor, ECF subfamily